MRPLELDGLHSVVVLGAHPDDVEIAAGGTLLSLAAANPGVDIHYALLTGAENRQQEARDAAIAFLPECKVNFAMHDLPDGHLPAYWGQVKEAIEALARRTVPDLVLAPSRDDAHQDHRTIAELVPTAFRDSLVLHYEIPKWDGDLGRPNLYLPMDEAIARRKVDLLHACFPSQQGRDWWDDEVFLGLARLRGMECRTRYAEAFYCHKAVLGLPAGE